jgi:hypothetical protein
MKFSEEHLAAAKAKTLLKRFATVEVSLIVDLQLILIVGRIVQSRY